MSGELIIQSPALSAIANQELQILEEINSSGERIADLIVKHFFNEKTDNWSVIGIDACGLDLARKQQLLRFELPEPADVVNGLIELYVNILKDIR